MDEDSMTMAVDEALFFVRVHGWTVADAVEITGACPEELERKQSNLGGRLPPCVPTPEMIRQ